MMKEELERAGVATYDTVLERLVEAWRFLRRMPDRERGWLREPRSPWPEVLRHSFFGDYPNEEPEDRPRLPGLRAAEVDRMNAVLGLGDEAGWLTWVPERDRKLVGVVLAQLERGDCAGGGPSWVAAARKLGWAGHPDTLAKRFGRAVAGIAVRLNRAKLAENAG